MVVCYFIKKWNSKCLIHLDNLMESDIQYCTALHNTKEYLKSMTKCQ